MAKKLSVLLAAVAVIAFAVPAFAQAAPELTINGVKAAKGETLTGTSTNATTQTSLGLITCTSVAVHGVVETNNGSTVEAVDDPGAGNTKGTHCTVGGKEVNVENVTLTKIHTNTVGSGSFVASFTATIGAVDCTFTTGGSPGTYVPTASPLVITLTNVNLVGTPAACEPGTLNGAFTVTSPGGVVVLH